jgi:dihydroxyacetone kinase-like predicted kinase
LKAPASTQLSGDGFASALISGIHRVIDDQELLNQINVFPVPDGDTGTNLSLSLGAALPVLQQSDEKHLGSLLAAVADALLDGARGNSGAIMAQFFQGMSDAAGELNRFTPYTFAKAVSMGNDYAHDAMSNPREGTILSVMAAFAASIVHHGSNNSDGSFSELVGKALQQSREALAETQNQLDVLRKAGVVDAGAKGFVELVDGISEYLSTGNIVAAPDLSLLSIEAPLVTAGSSLESGYRFCTESRGHEAQGQDSYSCRRAGARLRRGPWIRSRQRGESRRHAPPAEQ